MPEVIKKTKKKKADFNLDQEEMMKAGVHFGHRTSKYHPKMEDFLYGVRNSVHIIDLEKTVEKLKEALEFVQKLISEDKIIIFIGTKIQAKGLLKSFAQELSLPYVTERWLGGTLTNFETIKKRIDYFRDLEKKKMEGELEKYTKKEQVGLNRELEDLEMKFGGIKSLDKLPDAIFVLDMEKDAIAIKEARGKGVKVIGIADTSVDPTLADFPIPANDDALSSLKYILNKVKEAVLRGQESMKKETKEKETKEEETKE